MFIIRSSTIFFFFFFNDTATTEIYTLSLHDALPICSCTRGAGKEFSIHEMASHGRQCSDFSGRARAHRERQRQVRPSTARSEEHTSELQSRPHLVCRLLLEKKKNKRTYNHTRVHRTR